MAGERIKLTVKERESRGSADARRLRKQGFIPGVLYGKGKGSHAIYVPERDLRRVLTGAGGLHVILDGRATTHASILKDYQQDPIRGHISHIDLQEVRLDQPIQASVTVQLIGEPTGVKEGGVLSQIQREINVEALPMEIPEHIDLDVGGMAIGDTLRLADLAPVEGVTYLDDPEETVLASVGLPAREVEPEPEEPAEGEELAEGEEAPEGAAEGEGPAVAEAAAGEQGEPGTSSED